MYVGIGGVRSNVHTASSPSRRGSPAAGAFDTTFHDDGALTVKANVPLMSGWSKHAWTRWVPNGSKWEAQYTLPSTGSSKRYMPNPPTRYSHRPTTRSSFSA